MCNDGYVVLCSVEICYYILHACFLCFAHYILLPINQDLHLFTEICIESIFDVVHKAAHLLLSPTEAFGALKRLFSSHGSRSEENHDVADVSVSTAVLGKNNPKPSERSSNFNQSMNTDARTCQDVITELG